MKSVNSSLAPRLDHRSIIRLDIKKLLNYQLSEDEIIHLSDKFLTNGIHYVTVSSLHEGRSFIKKFLRSINYYQEITFLSSDIQTHPDEFHNLYMILNQLDEQQLTDFLCNNFYSDFLWIELTDDLIHSSWFDTFQRSITNLGFDKIMPIMLME